MFKYLLFVSLFCLYESRFEVTLETVDINDPEVKEAALFAAQEMGFGRIKYRLDQISAAKRDVGSHVMFELKVVLSDIERCSEEKSAQCKVSIF